MCVRLYVPSLAHGWKFSARTKTRAHCGQDSLDHCTQLVRGEDNVFSLAADILMEYPRSARAPVAREFRISAPPRTREESQSRGVTEFYTWLARSYRFGLHFDLVEVEGEIEGEREAFLSTRDLWELFKVQYRRMWLFAFYCHFEWKF